MSQFSFLSGFVTELLNQNGFEDMDAEQRGHYVPQITALLEEKLGLEMLPKLSPEHMETFGKMVDDANTTPEQWKDFWYGAIPEFESELSRILSEFGERVKGILAQQG